MAFTDSSKMTTMVRWICSAKLSEKIVMSDLRTYTGVSSIKDVNRCNHLCWFGHLHHVNEEKWPRMILNFEVNVSYPQDCPKRRWLGNSRCHLHEMWLSTSVPLDRVKWRNLIKPSRHVAEFKPRCQAITWIISK